MTAAEIDAFIQKCLAAIAHLQAVVDHLRALRTNAVPVAQKPSCEKTPATIADAVTILLQNHAELDLNRIQDELEKCFGKRSTAKNPKKTLRCQLDRWLVGKCPHPRFRRTRPNTYALV